MRYLYLISTLLSLVVVILGAYTRLSDAGLGCPDWPGCYGKIFPTQYESPSPFGERAGVRGRVDTKKAWTEMVHRYFAGALGFLILVIAILTIKRRYLPGQSLLLPLLLLGTVIFQALLGMWTVTLLLHPLVVMGHLLGGMATLGLCWWMTLCSRVHNSPQPPLTLRGGDQTPPLRIRGGREGLRRSALFALLILILQIALGGWVSANYSALACPDFPTCMGKWMPPMDLKNAFTVWKEWGQNFEGGILTQEGRVAIQILHRIGAVVTFIFLGFLAVKGLTRASSKKVKSASMIMILLLVTQLALGISTVLLIRPLAIATAHNAVAALLLLTVITLNDRIRTTEDIDAPGN